MKQSTGKAAKGMARVFLLPCLFAFFSCAEPPEKPVPALDQSKAVEKEKPAIAPSPPAKPGQVTRMPLGDLYQLVQNNAAVIYDVRPAIYHKMGNIPGSISWPKATYERDLFMHEQRIRAALAQSTPVVIYCTDLACPDALYVATRLAERGHGVSVLQGGYEAWKIAAQ
jgi:rhodanese-related sulfurtransferase